MKSYSSYEELVLSCGSWQEAERITTALLASPLVKTVETMETRSKRWWEGSYGQKSQLKLIIQTLEKDVMAVKHEIKKLRQGDSQPPYSIPMSRLSAEVSKWLRSTTEVKSAKLKQ